jgi:hypothetical protein
MESVETHQRLDLHGKTGKPSRFQAIAIIGLLELLRRGSDMELKAGSPYPPSI